ncbi:MAG: glycerate kinase [Pseudomonadota bacterium]
MTTIDDPVALLKALFEAGVRSAMPQSCMAQHLPEKPKGRTIVLSAGKAAASMTRAFEALWDGPIEGFGVTRYGHGVDGGNIEVVEAAHPVPDGQGETAARRMMQLVADLSADDLVVVLVSGGGSALLSLPRDGVSMDDKKRINKALLMSGAPINEMNLVRKHLSAIKGGKLAEACYPARVVALAISDVPGDDPGTIASGPTVANQTSRRQALDTLAKYNIDPGETVRQILEAGGDDVPVSSAAREAEFHLIATPKRMIDAVEAAARGKGLNVISLGADLEGEARDVGKDHAARALAIADDPMIPKPALLLSGGETTVTVQGEGGRGGRNCEYLLSLTINLAGDSRFFALSGDTDGIDGSEDNAGAWSTPSLLADTQAVGLDAQVFLDGHDSYSLFQKAGNLITTGPTRTNVNDLRMVLIQ